jgi:uncharacterized protein (TIGR02118 family)
MIKTLALIKRRPDLDRAAFRAHYEDVHVPLALPFLTGLIRYVRHHVVANRYGTSDFDVLTCFGFSDKAATDRVFALLEAEEGKAIREDERRFMDKDANRFFAVSERVLVDGEEGGRHLFVLVARPSTLSRHDASQALGLTHWPRLLAEIGDLEFALLRDGFPVQGGELPYDAVLQIGCRGVAGLERWSSGLEAEGYRVAAVETQRFETAHPAG